MSADPMFLAALMKPAASLTKTDKMFTLKSTMKLLKICLLLIAFSFLFALPTLAACSRYNCVTGDHGQCEEGAVLECMDRRRKCTNGVWEPTNESTNNRCTPTDPLTGPGWDLVEFQKTLKNWQTEGMTLETHIGGQSIPDTPTGVGAATVLTFTSMIVGDMTPIANQTPEETYRPGGAIGAITSLIGTMYANPPASSVEYLADIGRRLNPTQPAYAQGVGFEGLSPLLPLWKAFRNIAYLFFTIIFVVIGFAIMFRVKLNPQTVISIQNAIPRIIIALILVTFSYAIAGLMIDLLYLLLMLGITVLGWSGLLPDASQLQKQFISDGFPQMIGAMKKATPWGGFLAIGAMVGTSIGFAVSAGNIAGAAIGLGAGTAIFTLIIAIILLYVLFKLLIEMIKAYIGILIAVIFGPLQIMFNALPGQNTFGTWLKGPSTNKPLSTALAVFVLIARILTNKKVTGGLWTPPMMTGGATAAGLIGFGMLLLLSKIPEMIKGLFAGKPVPFGTGIGEALGAPGKVVGAGITGVVTAGKVRDAGIEPKTIRRGIKSLLHRPVEPSAPQENKERPDY